MAPKTFGGCGRERLRQARALLRHSPALAEQVMSGMVPPQGAVWIFRTGARSTGAVLARQFPQIKAGKYGNSEVVDLARTSAFVLNVRPPNGCEGRVLSEILN